MRRRKDDGSEGDSAKRRRSVEHPRRVRRILLIEPSRVDRVLVRAALTLKGRVETDLTEVVDLDLGLSLLLQRRYDLVLLEDSPGGQSSWETTRAIRGVAPRTPIIRHAEYLESSVDNGNGLDRLVEAVEAALGAAVAATVVTVVMQSFAWASWIAASVAS